MKRQRVNPEAVWTLREIALLMGVSHKTILRWIARLQFPAFKHSDGHWVTTRTAIARWVEANSRLPGGSE